MLKIIIEDWEKEHEKYETLCIYIKKILDDLIKSKGIYVKIDFRVKDSISLARKLINYKLENKEKGVDLTLDELYANLSDKAGLRIICRYSDEITPIIDLIKNQFKILKEDNKVSHLEYNQIGYKSYHLDVELKEENITSEELSIIRNLRAEIQVRTLCENVWAEVDHDIGYKPTSDIQYEIKRQIHCLGGLFEVADDSLSRIYNDILNSTKITEEYLLIILEPYFIKFFKMEYDRELSLRTLSMLKSFFETITPNIFEDHLKIFIEQNESQIVFFVSHYSQLNIENPYISQPEIILIFYLLKNNKHSLTDKWETEFFLEDLEKISELWGIPISDILND